MAIGRGLGERATTSLIARREQGPGLRWTEAAAAVAQGRVLRAHDHGDAAWPAA